MSVDFKNSETMVNLMRAFAGESQARNRYTFAADTAKKQKLYVVEAIFRFTAEQERAHAKIFYDYLAEHNGNTITADGGYPVNVTDSVLQLLRFAEHNENEEHDVVYKAFGEKAKEEGFLQIAASFQNIAEVEKVHGDRFAQVANWLEQGKLFVADAQSGWMCLNCGHISNTKGAPEVCPVCLHEQGYFVRLEMAPYTLR